MPRYWRTGSSEARASLAEFWERIVEAASWSPLQPSPLDRWLSIGNMDSSPGWAYFDNLSRLLSPYATNPLAFNPLREILAEVVDFQQLREACDARRVTLFLSATNVKSGRIKVFEGKEIGIDAVLASACLPFLFHAVEIDGAAYWDGGYAGNPPIFPLIYGTDCADVLVVQINPITIEDVPTSARAILDRVNTLSFIASLMQEMRAINFVRRLIDDEQLDRERYKRLNIHTIDAEAELSALGASSKLNASGDFIHWLFTLGHERCDHFLEAHAEQIGVASSTDVREKFL